MFLRVTEDTVAGHMGLASLSWTTLA